MRNKMIRLVVSFTLLISIRAFSQTTEKSEHPILDKYYPQLNKTNTNKTVATEIKPVQAPPVSPVVPAAPAVTSPAAPAPITSTVPAVTTDPAANSTPAGTAAPIVTTATAPVATAEPPVTTTTVSGVTAEPSVTTTPALTKSTSISKPAAVAPPTPVQNHGQPPPSLYSETRLGSSTKQYDTWEKNSNGAGSVTTSPK